jgi:hypothetical protein
MRIPKGPYQESFPIGSIVCIASRETLEEFERTWKFHNKLQPGQLNYAGKSGKVLAVGFYHGGDVLYTIDGAPGIWHEQCLQ